MIAQRGFTYVGLLLAVALAGVALAAAGTLWSTTSKRDKEREILTQYHQTDMAAIQEMMAKQKAAPVTASGK
jgi:type II secretory pathway pseudopilin PulG